MRIRTGIYWSGAAGPGRNQDSLSLQHISLQRGECLLALVCDGIGSLACSEEASGCAVHGMTDWFYHEGKTLILEKRSAEMILLALQKQLCLIQESLKILQRTQKIQTGTTLSGLLLIGNRYYLIQIGDSRIYRIRKRNIPIYQPKYHTVCLTKDDRNQEGHLLKCLGMAGRDRALVESGRVRKKTCFLLCTDGFYRGSQSIQIGQVLGPLLDRAGKSGRQPVRNRQEQNRQFDRRLELLAEQSQKAGSRDHMAAVGILIP